MPFSLAVRANVLSSRPHARWALRAPMKSAKDPEKFHATRAVRQPSSKILDPSDIAKATLFLRISHGQRRCLDLNLRVRSCFDSLTTASGRCLRGSRCSAVVVTTRNPARGRRGARSAPDAQCSPSLRARGRGFGCSRGRYDGLENPDVARQLREGVNQRGFSPETAAAQVSKFTTTTVTQAKGRDFAR
jgi:hypothetical protein